MLRAVGADGQFSKPSTEVGGSGRDSLCAGDGGGIGAENRITSQDYLVGCGRSLGRISGVLA